MSVRGLAVLLRRFAVGLRMALRFCCGGLPSVCAWLCDSVGTSGVRFTPVFFPLSGKKRRLAMPCVPIPPGRDRHSRVLGVSVWLSAFGRFTSGLVVSLWRSRRGYRGAEDGDTGLAARPLCVFAQAHWRCCAFRREYVGAPRPKPAPKSLRLSGLSSRCGGVVLVRVRGLCALLCGRIGLAMLSAGSTLGLRTPDCAKESNVEAALPPLWTLFTLRRSCVGADSRRLYAFAWAHWPCNAFRGEYVGGYAPPNLRQRVFDSLDSLQGLAE